MVCFEVCLPHMSACELVVQGDEHKIAPHVYPCDPMVAIGWGGSFSGGPGTFTVLRESRQEATCTILRPFSVGHFCRFTQTPNFSSACFACENKGTGGGGKIAEIAERAAHFGPSDASKRRVLLNAAEKIDSQGQPRVALTTPSRASTSLMRLDCFPVHAVLSMTL